MKITLYFIICAYLFTFETRTVELTKELNGSEITGLIDYEDFCGIGSEQEKIIVKEISVRELEALINTGKDFQLIDVREPHEYQISNIGGELIPLGEIEEALNLISRSKQVILHCRSGVRSAQAIEILEKKFGFANLYNLKGGILAWAKQIDNSLPKY